MSFYSVTKFSTLSPLNVISLCLSSVGIYCANEKPYNDVDFARKKNMFSDQAHFYFGGYVNIQNCNIWGLGTPHVVF